MIDYERYKNEDEDVESLSEKGWISFSDAYGTLLKDEVFVNAIKKVLENSLYEKITPILKREIVFNLNSIIITYSNKMKMDYELKVASYKFDPSCMVILARKLP